MCAGKCSDNIYKWCANRARQIAYRVEGYAADRVRVSRVVLYQLPGPHVPNVYSVVLAPGGKTIAVGVECNGIYSTVTRIEEHYGDHNR